MITRHNYEIWFMDHLDGKLSQEQQSMLIKFLQTNPDLEAELIEMKSEMPEMVNDSPVFKFSSLKKVIVSVGNISESNYEEKFVAHHENDLSTHEQKILDDFLIQNPFLVSELEYLGKVMVSHNGEEFPRKQSLKKKPTVIPMIRYAAAASVLILLGMGVVRYAFTTQKQSARVLDNELPFPNLNGIVLSETPKPISIDTKNIRPNPHTPKEDKREKNALISLNNNESPIVSNAGFDMDLATSTILYKPVQTVTPYEDAMSLRQIIGKLIEGGVGDNGVSEGLEKEEKVTGGDIVDLAAAPFRNADEPILATSEDGESGKRRVRFNIGFFEADFALK